MKSAPIHAFLFYLLFFGLLSGCNFMNNEKNPSPDARVDIKIGQSGENFEQKYPGLVAVNRQPAGLTFYKIAWSGSTRGIVHIDAGKHSFDIPGSISVVGTEDVEHKSEGIFHLSAISDIAGPHGISHANARDKIFDFFDVLRRSGWQATVPFGVPRLAGKEMLTYHLKDVDNTTLDPAYRPPLDEWMKLQDLTAWEFYAGRMFLRARLMRDESHLDVHKPGFYILNIVVRSDEEYFKDFVGPENRDRWIELLPSELHNLAERRQAKEDELIKAGVAINQIYRDPPLPAAALKN